ncbi:MAG: zinc ribbon domain-containing protein [Verrucomicrobiales bacterium]|nr:zinc ribbon domain-containing protein [Verrucomicrobiales bacterium]
MLTPETCPNCGADVPSGARACPECGADERTGWSEDAVADRLGLSNTEGFDHADFVRNELGEGAKATRPAWWWILVILLVLTLLGIWGVGRFFQ